MENRVKKIILYFARQLDYVEILKAYFCFNNQTKDILMKRVKIQE